MRILVITKDNNLVLDFDYKTLDGIIDKSVEFMWNKDWIVIKLLEDYKTEWKIKVWVKDWKLTYTPIK